MHIRRTELIKRATAPQSLTEPTALETFDVLATALTQNKAQLFPTRRRPKLWELETAAPLVMEEWFSDSGILIDNSLTKLVFASGQGGEKISHPAPHHTRGRGT